MDNARSICSEQTRPTFFHGPNRHTALYRRRLIPAECVPLSDDRILLCQDGLLVTSWKTIRPKKNMDHGISCYYLDDGFKISKFYRADHSLLYYYCDIISPAYEPHTNTLTVTDLLADVIIEPDHFVRVADMDELALAFADNLLSPQLLQTALFSLDRLLKLLYSGQLPRLLGPMEAVEKGLAPEEYGLSPRRGVSLAATAISPV
ncbi:MAG: DUF402 domain-containing protein [Eubacteriales bacterium]|nr:DUF402 domain-containing protein [Eubacteriales bacterium]